MVCCPSSGVRRHGCFFCWSSTYFLFPCQNVLNCFCFSLSSSFSCFSIFIFLVAGFFPQVSCRRNEGDRWRVRWILFLQVLNLSLYKSLIVVVVFSLPPQLGHQVDGGSSTSGKCRMASSGHIVDPLAGFHMAVAFSSYSRSPESAALSESDHHWI